MSSCMTEDCNIRNHLQELLAEQGPAYDINLRIFHELQSTITGWPGGKPTAVPTAPQKETLETKKLQVVKLTLLFC